MRIQLDFFSSFLRQAINLSQLELTQCAYKEHTFKVTNGNVRISVIPTNTLTTLAGHMLIKLGDLCVECDRKFNAS